jgi:DNA-binding MarR family transcriptional regulator
VTSSRIAAIGPSTSSPSPPDHGWSVATRRRPRSVRPARNGHRSGQTRSTAAARLAEQAQVTKQTAGFLVDQLEKAGYVHRVPDPTDARARLVRIAPRGAEALAIARVTEADVEAEWTKHLGKVGADQLRRALTRLREITDPFSGGDAG